MKKLSFVFALVFAASFAMAQHVDVISQQGGNNSGVVMQAGAQPDYGSIITVGSDNNATIYQNNNGFGGAGLKAYVDQNGNGNHALVDQGQANTTFGHVATIDQDGNANSADILQVDGQPSTAYIRQAGNGNDADQLIYSDGQANSSAYIWQEGGANTAYQNLGMGNFVSGSSFASTQVGSDNVSDQRIFSNEPSPLGADLKTINNHGTVVSSGNGNYARQWMQDNAAGENWDNTAIATQGGNANQSWQYQFGVGNTSTVSQLGSGNFASSTQVH